MLSPGLIMIIFKFEISFILMQAYPESVALCIGLNLTKCLHYVKTMVGDAYI